MNIACVSRFTKLSRFSGISTIRRPSGSFSPDLASAKWLDMMKVLATASVSTTLITARDFIVCDWLRERDHQIDIALGDRSFTRAAFEIVHLLDDVSGRLSREVRVFRAAGTIRAMTESAGVHVGFPALRDDCRQRWMLAGMPDGCDEAVA